jgi:hypothetical protein
MYHTQAHSPSAHVGASLAATDRVADDARVVEADLR